MERRNYGYYCKPNGYEKGISSADFYGRASYDLNDDPVALQYRRQYVCSQAWCERYHCNFTGLSSAKPHLIRRCRTGSGHKCLYCHESRNRGYQKSRSGSCPRTGAGRSSCTGFYRCRPPGNPCVSWNVYKGPGSPFPEQPVYIYCRAVVCRFTCSCSNRKDFSGDG